MNDDAEGDRPALLHDRKAKPRCVASRTAGSSAVRAHEAERNRAYLSTRDNDDPSFAAKGLAVALGPR